MRDVLLDGQTDRGDDGGRFKIKDINKRKKTDLSTILLYFIYRMNFYLFFLKICCDINSQYFSYLSYHMLVLRNKHGCFSLRRL